MRGLCLHAGSSQRRSSFMYESFTHELVMSPSCGCTSEEGHSYLNESCPPLLRCTRDSYMNESCPLPLRCTRRCTSEEGVYDMTHSHECGCTSEEGRVKCVLYVCCDMTRYMPLLVCGGTASSHGSFTCDVTPHTKELWIAYFQSHCSSWNTRNFWGWV